MVLRLRPPAGRGVARQPSRRPYRQGDLDGLCGIYSIINAVRSLCRELTRKHSARLFKHLVQNLHDRSSKPLSLVCGGIGSLTLSHLLKLALAFVERRLGITLKARRLPGAVRTSHHLDQLWRALDEALSLNGVAIICVTGRISHWTVVSAVGPKHLTLLDSSDLKQLPRARCTAGWAEALYSISARDVIVLERAEAISSKAA